MLGSKKGLIDVEYAPTICHKCHRVLVQTFVMKGDINVRQRILVLCGDCVDARLIDMIQEDGYNITLKE